MLYEVITQRLPVYWLGGRRHLGGMTFIQAWLRNLGTCITMQREKTNRITLEAEYRQVMQGRTKPY